MQLRSYLEGKANLTLPTLRRILRSHYQEKSATDLYKHLTSEVQGIKETLQSFLIRAFDLRQKSLFSSQEAESGLKYDPGLVQNMFLHTVLTGLQSDNIKRDLQPYLEQTDISDELLLEHMNTASAYETERQNERKLLGQQRPLTIHSVQSSDTPVKKEKSSAQQNLSKIPPMLLSQLEEMRSEMALLKDRKAEVSQIRESMQPPQCMPRQHPAAGGPDGTSAQQFPSQQMQDMRRCYGCQQHGAEDYCTHCYRCGSSKHFLAGCRARGQRQFGGHPLNRERSLARDRE